jgi:hypothetical protein
MATTATISALAIPATMSMFFDGRGSNPPEL